MKHFLRHILTLALAAALGLALLLPAGAISTDCQITAAAGGQTHTIALKSDGTVWTVGSNEQGQLGRKTESSKEEQKFDQVTFPAQAQITEVAAGYYFSAALGYNGIVYTWGGEKDNTAPRKVDGLDNVVSISAGQLDLLALKNDGTVWQWTLGGTPRQIEGLESIAAVSAGGGHYLALTAYGDVWAWGSNSSGQLGNGSTTDSDVPVKVESLFNIVDIAAGSNHSLAVGFNGIVYAWGDNGYGQLAEAQSTKNRTEPTAVSNLKSITQVAAGNASSMARTQDGKVYAWGYGEYGQLGSGKTDTLVYKPTQVTSGNLPASIDRVVCGFHHNMAITSNGVLYAWGRNRNHQINATSNGNISAPYRALSGLATDTDYKTSVFHNISPWALEGAETLYTDGLVPPMFWNDYQGNITRAEFAHLLVSVYEQVKGSAVSPSRSAKFEDIEDHLLATDILKAYQLNLISGTSPTTFEPDAFITREQAAKMLCTFFGRLENDTVPDKTVNLSAYYDDAEGISEWAAIYVAYAHDKEIMKGSGTSFRPNELLTREQSLQVLSNLVENYDWAD